MTPYELRISDWSSYGCASDLASFVPAAMRENDACGIPSDHPLDRGLELWPSAREGQPHVPRHPAARVLHTAQPGQPAREEAAQLGWLEVLHEIGEHQR